MISSGVWIEYMSVTDRQTDSGRRLVAVQHLRIASRGNIT